MVRKVVSNFICMILKILIVIVSVYKDINKKINEKIYANQTVTSVIGCIIYAPIIAFISIWLIISINNKIPISTIILINEVVIFIIYTKMVSTRLKYYRLDSEENNMNTQNVYYVFGIFYLICIVLSMTKESCTYYILTNVNAEHKFGSINMQLKDMIDFTYGIVNSMKEAILTAIIFDTVYQANVTSKEDAIIGYVQELLDSGRLYVFPKSNYYYKKNEVWCILGDAGADTIYDDAPKYKIRVDKSKYIKYTSEQAEELIEDRKSKLPKCIIDNDEHMLLMYRNLDEGDIRISLNPNQPPIHKAKDGRRYKYYIKIFKVDISCVDITEKTRKEINNLINKHALKLPQGVSIEIREGILEKALKHIQEANPPTN